MPRGGAVSSCGARTAGEVNRQARRHACRVTRARRTKWTRARVPRPRGGARPTPMRCGRQRIRSRPTNYACSIAFSAAARSACVGTLLLAVSLQAQPSERRIPRRCHQARPRSLSGRGPRQGRGFARHIAARNRRVCARTRKVRTPASRRARERRTRAASGDGERSSIALPLLQPHNHGRPKADETRQDRGADLVRQGFQVHSLAALGADDGAICSSPVRS